MEMQGEGRWWRDEAHPCLAVWSRGRFAQCLTEGAAAETKVGGRGLCERGWIGPDVLSPDTFPTVEFQVCKKKN